MREALGAGRTSARALVEDALAAVEEHEPFNIFTSLDPDNALAAANRADEAYSRGNARPLEGVPIAIKDNIAVAGQPFSGGSRALGAAPASMDAKTVAVLREAGAIVIGKTNLHEFAFGVTSNNPVFGPVANPRAPGRCAGGSSGGSAAAVAAGIVPVALGTDTGGSGRIPAAFCGCTGFRPTTGRYPLAGVMQLTWTLDTVALFATAADDIVLLDRLLGGCTVPASPRPPRPDELSLGIPEDSFAADLDHPVAVAFKDALASLKVGGVRLVSLSMAEVLELDRVAALPVAIFEAAALWRRELARRKMEPAQFIQAIAGPDVREIFARVLGDAVSVNDYAEAMNEAVMPMRHIYSGIFAKAGIDAIAFPTVAVPPPLLGVNDSITVNGNERPLFPSVIRNTSPGAVAGIPGISLPFGTMAGGLPFGLELDAPAGGDRRLLAVAQSIARLAPR